MGLDRNTYRDQKVFSAILAHVSDMPAKKGGRTRCVVYTVCALVILVLLILVIWLATREKEEIMEVPVNDRTNSFGYIRPKAIPTQDGIHVTWYPMATRHSDIVKAAQDSYDMVDVVTHVEGQDGGITLDNIWDILQTNNIGVKLNVDNNDDAETIIGQLKTRTLDQPILISVPMFAPNSDFDWQRFTQTMSDTTFASPVAVNIHISPPCCDPGGLGHGVMEYIGFLVQASNFTTTVEINADWVRSSWTDIKWLLDTNPSLQLIQSTPSEYTVTKYDLLLVRNDIAGDKVLYNIDRELYREFVNLSSTAGSPLLYFGITPPDASEVRWSHNTDTWEQLNAATQGDAMMIEGDIMLLGQDTPQQTNIPIMAHDVGDNNNLTFEEWVDEIIKVDKGMKLDFKTMDAVQPALEIINRKKARIKGPVWANASILKGPNAMEPRIPADVFITAVNNTFPDVVFSLGWTTISKGDNSSLHYTMDMVHEMYDVVKDLSLPITYPIRAEQLVDSWFALEWLLSQSRGYTLTIWTAKQDNVTKADMDIIRWKTEASRIYFDLPADLLPTIYTATSL